MKIKFSIIKKLFLIDEFIKKIEYLEKKVREIEIKNASMESALKIIQTGIEVTIKK